MEFGGFYECQLLLFLMGCFRNGGFLGGGSQNGNVKSEQRTGVK